MMTRLTQKSMYPYNETMIKPVFIQQTFEEICISTYPYEDVASSQQPGNFFYKMIFRC